jgi:hypothetical protein
LPSCFCRRALINALALLFAAVSAGAQVTQINVSQDLVALGIARQNAVPGNPTADARPLFQAAIQYATANGINRIVADPGAYWFLTPQHPGTYLELNNVSGLTVNLQGSDIYLLNSFATGMFLSGCQGVTLANFTIDYVNLPYTQVRLTGVSAGSGTLYYETIPGWSSPANLQSPDGSTAYYGIVLRGGFPIANASRLALKPPASSSSTLQVIQDTSPWTQPAVLATYQPGDIAVVTLRDGDSTILVAGGNGNIVRGVEIYSSSAMGLHMDSASNSTVMSVGVLPRPGTDRLISTNADGIHMSYLQTNNMVQRCYVSRTMDDGMALNSPFLAFVNSVTGLPSVRVTRNFSTQIPDGTAVSFLNPSTGQTIGRYILVSQNPAFGAPNVSQTVTYTFDQDIPAVQNGFGLVYADEVNRGLSSVVQNNVVETILFARGIFLGGVAGVTIQENTVRQTNCGGIVLHHDLAAYPSAANQDIQVVGNTVDQAIGPAAVGTGAIAALGSIFVLATDTNFIPLPTATETNITILNNSITNAGRSALWIGNVNGGTIQGNAIGGYDLYPQLALWGISQALANQLTVDFTQAVAVHNNLNVSVQQNR